MTDEYLDTLWKRLSSATNVKNKEYGEAVTIGSVFGEMKTEIKRLQEINKKYEFMIDNGLGYEDLRNDIE